MKTSNLELLFVDSEPKTKHEVAHVVVKVSTNKSYGSLKAEGLITSSCLNFREFDAEIRRLQTELEIIRAEARKKFARAQAAAA
jgi:hypothetical protein